MVAHSRLVRTLPVLVLLLPLTIPAKADERAAAFRAAQKATTFLTEQVSTEGGYLWCYSSDLKKREGEGVVESSTIWVQPPGTPSVGEAFVRLYQATGDEQFLAAARAAGEALRRGQMRSGGWQASVEFDPQRRRKWAYRIELEQRKQKDQSSLDDDKTQSAIRFITRLDQALDFKDASVHEMAMYALDGLINRGQFANGGFPQVWTAEKTNDALRPARQASFPESWPKEYPGHNEYWYRYTLNDNLATDVVDTLFLAAEIYGDVRYRQSALRLADSLLLAQLPEPQPAWAQQYSAEMQPIWARKFEPPAVTGGESQSVIRTLMNVYQQTGDRKYLEPLPRALDYLQRSQLPDGQLARFYELKTNRPLYFTRQYELTYDDSDVPTHYGFKIRSKVDRLREEYDKLMSRDWRKPEKKSPPRRPSDRVVRQIIEAQDGRGAWVSDSPMRYHKSTDKAIEMSTAVENLQTLADYLDPSSR